MNPNRNTRLGMNTGWDVNHLFIYLYTWGNLYDNPSTGVFLG